MTRILLFLFILWWFIVCTYQQDTTDDDDDDSCAYISGQNCDNDGICKYCAMCLQSSCILSKSIPSNKTIGNPVCNATQFGTTNVYDWYGYCLSSGNDNSGDYCATSTECYQYRRNSNASTSYIWQSLTCDPNSCLLVTDNGQPAPTPGVLPPSDSPSASSNHNNPASSHPISSHHHNEAGEEHNPTAIALSVTCTLIFVGALAWLFRLWKRSRYWPPPFLKHIAATTTSSSSTTTVPNSAPPSFRSTAPEMACIATTSMTDGSRQQQQQQQRPIPSSRSSSRSSNNREGEALPSYFSPDPSPPKYEHAIVTQIRGLLEDSNYHYHAGPSSSMDLDHHHHHQGYNANDDSMAMDHHSNALPPPMWVPIYFAPNHTSFSLGRLRRHPQHQPLNHPSPASSPSNIFQAQQRRQNQRSSSTAAGDEQDLGSSSAISSSATMASSTSSSISQSRQQQ
ncbi:hypothetical protein BCR42DRAFT_427523 [Absidia repens]|uniref:Uncharacterized protein n=1 Tax=Absidia repens TaxID=90262 RepID=A0A1X2HZQ1_9FUNG|nr:hypothetical protein BCR42DRAFT_427523 [Absidia repens]